MLISRDLESYRTISKGYFWKVCWSVAQVAAIRIPCLIWICTHLLS